MLGGMPIRDYRAEIDLEPEGDGTTLRWRSTFSPIVPGIGWISGPASSTRSLRW